VKYIYKTANILGKTSGTGTQYKTRVVRKRLAAAVENLNFEIQRSWKTSV